MKEYKVPVQSLIDHIKTAIDVDPWAKEMAEELLKEQEAKIEQLKRFVNGFSRDAMPVVRCKDCVECYFASNRIQSEQTLACGKHGIDVTPEWFCADGKQQEGR